MIDDLLARFFVYAENFIFKFLFPFHKLVFGWKPIELANYISGLTRVFAPHSLRFVRDRLRSFSVRRRADIELSNSRTRASSIDFNVSARFGVDTFFAFGHSLACST